MAQSAVKKSRRAVKKPAKKAKATLKGAWTTITEIESCSPCWSRYLDALKALKSNPTDDFLNANALYHWKKIRKPRFGPDDRVPLTEIMKGDSGPWRVSWVIRHVDRLDSLHKAGMAVLKAKETAWQKEVHKAGMAVLKAKETAWQKEVNAVKKQMAPLEKRLNKLITNHPDHTDFESALDEILGK